MIDFLRANGVAQYRNGDVELTLHEVLPPVGEMGFKTSVAEEVFNPPKKGADGLTAAQQEELYGVVYDAEKPQ